jgi:hypothetical protein
LKKWRKEKIFAVRRKLKRTAKTNSRLLQKWRKEKNLCRAPEIKTHGKENKTHGRELLCRAPDKRHTAKIQTHGKERVSGSDSCPLPYEDRPRKFA